LLARAIQFTSYYLNTPLRLSDKLLGEEALRRVLLVEGEGVENDGVEGEAA